MAERTIKGSIEVKPKPGFENRYFYVYLTDMRHVEFIERDNKEIDVLESETAHIFIQWDEPYPEEGQVFCW